MNLRKLFLSLLAAAVLVFGITALAACGGEEDPPTPAPSSYTVTFDANGGTFSDGSSTMEMIVLPGGTVNKPASPTKEGQAFSYWADASGEEYIFSTPVNANITLRATYTAASYTLEFRTDESADIVYEGETTLAYGSEVRFSLDVSPFYAGDAVVTVNGTALAADTDGSYSFEIAENSVVEVDGLYRETSAMAGRGTISSPYLVTRPVDMLEIAERVNAGDSAWANACYRLENDLDFKGEDISIIGDGSGSSGAAFYGYFDGNGHTISNFRIESSGKSFVGLFGYVVATITNDYSATIANLTLENYIIDASIDDNLLTVGSFVGYGIGANVYACQALGGEIYALASEDYFAYVGGIFGIQQSAYSSAYEVRSYSSATYVTSDVSINVLSGAVVGAGGISGYLIANEDMTTAYVANSYSSATVTGAMRSGGIIGLMAGYTSVTNSYATGDINAQTRFNDESIYGEYAYAFAGGLVGFAQNDTIVANSFATGDISASAPLGANYAFRGEIAGGNYVAGYPNISSQEFIDRNNYYAQGGKDDGIDFTDPAWVKANLGWSESDWTFEAGEYPKVLYSDASNVFTVTIDLNGKQVDGKTSLSFEIDTRYMPMAFWYLQEDGAAEFLDSDDGLRSYGYYFDSGLTQQVPYGFVPTKDVTLYAGFADYGAVAGEYYITRGQNRAIVLELTSDGNASYSDGARGFSFGYVYNGEYIVFRDASFARLTDDEEAEGTTETYDFFGKVMGDGTLQIYDGTFFTESEPLVAGLSKGIYGEYYDAGNHSHRYTFYEDFTGKETDDSKQYTFTYTLSDGSMTIRFDNEDRTATGTVEDGSILIGDVQFRALDRFLGKWEIFSSQHIEYEFDGMGGYTYCYYGYRYTEDAEGIQSGERYPIEEKSGTYTVSGEVMTLDDGTRISFNGDGFLSVYRNGQESLFGREHSYYGVWTDTYFDIWMYLYGIGESGIGNAVVQYEDGSAYSVTYTVDAEGLVELYSGAQNFGWIIYNPSGNLINAALYSPSMGMIQDLYEMCRVDEYEGEWVGETFFEIVDFNGLGYYDINQKLSDGTVWEVEGYITINGEQVRYYLENATLNGYFEYKGVRYDVSFLEDGTIEITSGDEKAQFERKDEFASMPMTDADGAVYEFDGRGNLSKGGTLTVTAAGGAESTYTYKIGEDGITLYNGEAAAGSITLSADGKYYVFTLTGGQAKNLTLQNLFTGEWALSGYMQLLTVGEMYADRTISGTFLGEEIEFTYLNEGILSFVSDGNRLYLLALEGGDIAVSGYTSLMLNDYILCARADDLFGAWEQADGTTLTFDGMGNSTYTYGLALLEKEGTQQVYYYMADRNGNYLIWTEEDGRAVSYKIEECGLSDAGAFVRDGKAFSLMPIDELYGMTATAPDGTVYTFDGEGGGSISDGGTFTYKVISVDSITMRCTVEITIDGNARTATVDYSESGAVTITFTEE